MTSHGWTDRLSDYIDRELTEQDRSKLDAHLAGCASCAVALDELRAVQARASQLPSRPPRHDLWPGIAERIASTAALQLDTPNGAAASRRRYAFSLPQLAAAGIALAVASGGGALLLRPGLQSADRGAVPAVQPAAAVTADAVSLRQASVRAEETYGAAVADLQSVLDAGRGQLSPGTIEVLERNLAVIDSAIAQAERAVAGDPANAYLNTHLTRTMRQKLDLLRQAAMLVRAQS